MIDHVRFSYPHFLNASKNTSYRKSIKSMGKSLMRFLVENNLILFNPFKEDGELKDDLTVRISDLTPEGVEILSAPVAKWWDFIDKSGDANDVKILKNALDQIRQRRARA